VLLAVGLVMSVGLLLAACGTDEPATTTGVTTATTGGTTVTTAPPATETTGTTVPLPAAIKVGAVIPLTGANAGLGAQVKGGYELAVADINAAGGIDIGGTKVPIELTILDDESDPNKTVQQLETLNSNGVVAYLGGAGSNLHAAAAGIAEKNKIPYLGIAFSLNSVHEQGFKYLFSPFPKSKDHAKATFDLLDSFTPKPTVIYNFQETTDGGKELTKYWTEEATARGGYQITTLEYAPGTTDFSSLIMQAKNANAEVVLGYPTPPDGLALMKQIVELGFNAKVYFLVRAPDPPTFGAADGLGADSDGVYLLPGWNNALPYPGVPEMAEAYKAATGKPAAALVGPAYACVQILADSITRAASLDRTAIRDAMAATNLDTMVGPGVQFKEDGTSNVLDPVVMWSGGKQVLVFPADVAKATPMYPATPWADR
jgi:branched-chain amino acid transport system substrate-binding protein